MLEDANIKLAGVATDVLGVSARAMLDALVSGQSSVEALAQLAKGRLRNKIPELEKALRGKFGAHHSFLIGEQLSHIDYLDEAIGRLSQQIAERLGPFQQELALLAEIGLDMNRFPTAHHLASWAAFCPGHKESGGTHHWQPCRSVCSTSNATTKPTPSRLSGDSLARI